MNEPLSQFNDVNDVQGPTKEALRTWIAESCFDQPADEGNQQVHTIYEEEFYHPCIVGGTAGNETGERQQNICSLETVSKDDLFSNSSAALENSSAQEVAEELKSNMSPSDWSVIKELFGHVTEHGMEKKNVVYRKVSHCVRKVYGKDRVVQAFRSIHNDKFEAAVILARLLYFNSNQGNDIPSSQANEMATKSQSTIQSDISAQEVVHSQEESTSDVNKQAKPKVTTGKRALKPSTAVIKPSQTRISIRKDKAANKVKATDEVGDQGTPTIRVDIVSNKKRTMTSKANDNQGSAPDDVTAIKIPKPHPYLRRKETYQRKLTSEEVKRAPVINKNHQSGGTKSKLPSKSPPQDEATPNLANYDETKFVIDKWSDATSSRLMINDQPTQIVVCVTANDAVDSHDPIDSSLGSMATEVSVEPLSQAQQESKSVQVTTSFPGAKTHLNLQLRPSTSDCDPEFLKRKNEVIVEARKLKLLSDPDSYYNDYDKINSLERLVQETTRKLDLAQKQNSFKKRFSRSPFKDFLVMSKRIFHIDCRPSTSDGIGCTSTFIVDPAHGDTASSDKENQPDWHLELKDNEKLTNTDFYWSAIEPLKNSPEPVIIESEKELAVESIEARADGLPEPIKKPVTPSKNSRARFLRNLRNNTAKKLDLGNQSAPNVLHYGTTRSAHLRQNMPRDQLRGQCQRRRFEPKKPEPKITEESQNNPEDNTTEPSETKVERKDSHDSTAKSLSLMDTSLSEVRSTVESDVEAEDITQEETVTETSVDHDSSQSPTTKPCPKEFLLPHPTLSSTESSLGKRTKTLAISVLSIITAAMIWNIYGSTIFKEITNHLDQMVQLCLRNIKH